MLRHAHDVRHNINTLLEKLPEALRATPDAARFLHAYGCVTTMDIVQLIYRPEEPQGSRPRISSSAAAPCPNAGTPGVAMRRRRSPRRPAGAHAPEIGARTFDLHAPGGPVAQGGVQAPRDAA